MCVEVRTCVCVGWVGGGVDIVHMCVFMCNACVCACANYVNRIIS